jgi:hypothetical protein
MSHLIKNFEELREHLFEDKHAIMENMVDSLDDCNPLLIGRFQGQIWALDSVIATLRNIFKYRVEA